MAVTTPEDSPQRLALAEGIGLKPLSPSAMFWRQFRRHIAALVSVFVLAVLLIVCLAAPLIAPYRFDAIDLRNSRQPPTLKHLMGTDELGHDEFSARLVWRAHLAARLG